LREFRLSLNDPSALGQLDLVHEGHEGLVGDRSLPSAVLAAEQVLLEAIPAAQDSNERQALLELANDYIAMADAALDENPPRSARLAEFIAAHTTAISGLYFLSTAESAALATGAVDAQTVRTLGEISGLVSETIPVDADLAKRLSARMKESRLVTTIPSHEPRVAICDWADCSDTEVGHRSPMFIADTHPSWMAQRISAMLEPNLHAEINLQSDCDLVSSFERFSADACILTVDLQNESVRFEAIEAKLGQVDDPSRVVVVSTSYDPHLSRVVFQNYAQFLCVDGLDPAGHGLQHAVLQACLPAQFPFGFSHSSRFHEPETRSLRHFDLHSWFPPENRLSERHGSRTDHEVSNRRR
jgi:hypothetical protein